MSGNLAYLRLALDSLRRPLALQRCKNVSERLVLSAASRKSESPSTVKDTTHYHGLLQEINDSRQQPGVEGVLPVEGLRLFPSGNKYTSRKSFFDDEQVGTSCDCCRVTLVFYRKRAFEGDCALVRCSGALSIKPFESSRPAADAGLMQIEWSEGAVSSCGELCGKARKTTPLVGKFAEAQNGC
jgi:hypothetical protein